MRTFVYDSLSRLTSAMNPENGTASYAYDGEGCRVRKSVNGAATIYVYDAFGQLAVEYGQGTQQAGTQYVTPDHLGSTRLVTRSGPRSAD